LVGPRELLHHDHRAQEVRARAAVLLVEPRAQEALRPGLAPGLAVDLALLAPALLVRANLAIDELAERLMERVVVGREQRAVHSPVISRRRRSAATIPPGRRASLARAWP